VTGPGESDNRLLSWGERNISGLSPTEIGETGCSVRPAITSILDFVSGNSAPDGSRTFIFGRHLSYTKRLTLRVGYVSATETEVTSEIYDEDPVLSELQRTLQARLSQAVCTSVR
jgi:hypothetical protein